MTERAEREGIKLTVHERDGSVSEMLFADVEQAYAGGRTVMDRREPARLFRVTYVDGSALEGEDAAKFGELALQTHGFPFRQG